MGQSVQRISLPGGAAQIHGECIQLSRRHLLRMVGSRRPGDGFVHESTPEVIGACLQVYAFLPVFQALAMALVAAVFVFAVGYRGRRLYRRTDSP